MMMIPIKFHIHFNNGDPWRSGYLVQITDNGRHAIVAHDPSNGLAASQGLILVTVELQQVRICRTRIPLFDDAPAENGALPDAAKTKIPRATV